MNKFYSLLQRKKHKTLFAINGLLFSIIGQVLFSYIGIRVAEMQLTVLDFIVGFYVFELFHQTIFFIPSFLIGLLTNNSTIWLALLALLFIILGILIEGVDFKVRKWNKGFSTSMVKALLSFIYSVVLSTLVFAFIILPIELVLSIFYFYFEESALIINVMRLIDSLSTSHVLDLIYVISILIMSYFFYKRFNKALKPVSAKKEKEEIREKIRKHGEGYERKKKMKKAA